jgi:hypothetical protein
MKKSVIVYLAIISVFTFVVGFFVGGRLISQRKDKVFDLTNDFVLSAEVSTQLDMHSYLGEAMLRDDQESNASAMEQLAALMQLGLERIAEDRSGIGQLSNQQKIDRSTHIKNDLLERAQAVREEIKKQNKAEMATPRKPSD